MHRFFLPLALAATALLGATAAADEAFFLTPHGAQYRDLRVGEGDSVQLGDVAVMHFVGWVDAGGKQGRELLDSHDRGEPVAFLVGTDRVMPGWNEGVLGMKPGGRRLVHIPPRLGYGKKGVEGIVPPDAGLIFILELLEVRKARP